MWKPKRNNNIRKQPGCLDENHAVGRSSDEACVMDEYNKETAQQLYLDIIRGNKTAFCDSCIEFLADYVSIYGLGLYTG